MHIRCVRKSDAGTIARIYNHYVEQTVITFEETPFSVDDIEARIAEVTETLPWLVAEEDGQVIGYAYASPWKGRCAYRFSAEISFYLAPQKRGKGVGSRLCETLIQELEKQGMHSLISAIALPNEASEALHRKFGFEKVGQFKEVGRKFDRWIDVAYYEKLLP